MPARITRLVPGFRLPGSPRRRLFPAPLRSVTCILPEWLAGCKGGICISECNICKRVQVWCKHMIREQYRGRMIVPSRGNAGAMGDQGEGGKRGVAMIVVEEQLQSTYRMVGKKLHGKGLSMGTVTLSGINLDRQYASLHSVM